MTPMRKQFEEDYTRFLRLRKEHPELAHKDHEPDPKNYGYGEGVLSEWEINKTKQRIEREVNRVA